MIISAPSADAPMYVCGVNLDKYDPSHKVVRTNNAYNLDRYIILFFFFGYRSPMRHARPTVSLHLPKY